jgi:hypothetical protein
MLGGRGDLRDWRDDGGSFDNGGSDQYDSGDDRVQVTLGAGDNPACTFYNTKVASLDIEKLAVDAGGTFNFVGTGLDNFSRVATTNVVTTTAPIVILPPYGALKYVVETVPTGWAVTNIVCTGNGATIKVGTGSGAQFDEGESVDFEEGENSIEVNIGSGDTPTCTFTNRLKPKLTVAKTTAPTTDGGKFDFKVAGTDYTNGGTGYGNGDSEANIVLNPGSITFSESAHTGTDLSDYVSTLACVGKTPSPNGGTSGTISLQYGENATCTFTNSKKPKLKVAKTTAPITDLGKFDFTIDGVTYNNSNAGYGNGDATDYVKFDQGSISFSEAAHTGTILTQYDAALSCGSKAVTAGTGNTSGIVSLMYGDVVYLHLHQHQEGLHRAQEGLEG